MEKSKRNRLGWGAFVTVMVLLALAFGVDTLRHRDHERPARAQLNRESVQDLDTTQPPAAAETAVAPRRSKALRRKVTEEPALPVEEAMPTEPGSNEAVVIETLEASFSTDAAPNKLSGEREMTLQSAFRAEGLGALTDGLSNLSCRASLCRGELNVKSEQADQELFSKVVVQGPLLNDIPGVSFTIARREPLADGSLRVVFFVHPPEVLSQLSQTL